MKYCNIYWQLKTAVIDICILIAIVQSNKVGISSERIKYLEDGEELSGALISTTVARSKIDCTLR